jgi:hypothetical protein
LPHAWWGDTKLLSMEQVYFLVIKADRSMRIAKKPRLGPDEVAVKVKVKFPEGWGTTIGTIDITAPEFHPEVRYEQVQDAETPT